MQFDKAWRARSTIQRVRKPDVRAMVERHYLHCYPAVAPCVLSMLVDDEPVGMVIFALPPKQTAARYGGVTWELARLWIDDAIPRNAETWLIAQATRYVRHQFPEVVCLVSYADPSAGHAGTIYKAANWKADGMTDDDRKTPRFDYLAGGKRYQRRAHVPAGLPIDRIPRVSKHRFIYRLTD